MLRTLIVTTKNIYILPELLGFDAWNESLLTASHDTICAVGAEQVQHLPASTRLLGAAKHQSSNVNRNAILAVIVRYTQSPGDITGCSMGPLSRDGWAVLDDTDSIRVDPDTRWLANAPGTPLPRLDRLFRLR